ncbi:polysaccharide deacetylase family protein [Pseudovibrio exalbescens]|uniref:polysaccharide deacetylase family protein n=1 Tax=Pseudovibrio exalbescens TaxID=197461 RepID=UPI002366F03A|nr:polysaccharide deacetylase family protein [Pseudovibrio exalbescens]MDD7909111.1 polysaccharide deacetylase family protein [Pseudovibrio exalbescens]
MTAADALALDAFRSSLRDHLDWFAARGQKVRFWWRDDDAIEPTDDLERLLDIAKRYSVPVALAVIPKHAKETLAARLETSDEAWVLQHGWQHKNFQRKDLGEKAAELGSRRDLDEITTQLEEGFARLSELFPDRFIPAVVPPWNRIDPGVVRRLEGIGLKSLSTFTWMHPYSLAQVQSHVDIIKWKKNNRFIGWKSAMDRFDLQFMRRRTNPQEPLGILTHHLAHEEGCYTFLEEFLSIAANHPGAAWPALPELFAEEVARAKAIRT